MNLPVQELTQAAFDRFGTVIEKPQAPADAAGPGWHWWGQTALLAGDDRPYAVGFLDLAPTDLRFDWAERHMRSAEVIIPTQGDCLVYVAPPEHMDEPGRLPELDQFQVFRVRAGQGVLLDPGVWHGAPFAADRPTQAIVFLLQKSGEVDTSLVRFEQNPVHIQR